MQQQPKPLTGSLAQHRTNSRSMLANGPSPLKSLGKDSTLEGSSSSVGSSLADSVSGLSTLNSTCSSVNGTSSQGLVNPTSGSRNATSLDASGKKRVSLSVSSSPVMGNSSVVRKESSNSSFTNASFSSHDFSVPHSPSRGSPTRLSGGKLPSMANDAPQQRQQRPSADPAKTAAKSLVTQYPQTVTSRNRNTNVWALASVEKNTSPCKALRFTPMIPEQSIDMKGRMTLVLDIDETLVHASFERCACDLRMKLDVAPGNTCQVYVNFRPGLQEFLAFCCANFEVVAFTASQKVYADPLLNALENAQVKFPLRLYREHCTSLGGSYVKDLHLLGRDLNRIAIVDNSPVCYTFQQRNAVPIISWFSDRNDKELEQTIDSVLRKLIAAETVYPTLDAFNSAMATGL